MNINEQLHELATAGGVAYAPSDDLVASLLSKTRRVRATRQSAATLASAIGAVALGMAATQAYNAAKEDPAFRDRNIINNKDGLSQIELYRAKFGQENPTRTYESTDLSDIIDKLRQAAKPPTPPTKPTTVLPASGGTTTTKPSGGSSGGDPYAQCKADHPPKPYKTYDCKTGQWVVNAGWYKDPDSGQYYECTNQPAYEGYTYDCSKGAYVPKSGYFLLGNGHIYKNILWTDAATGQTSWGNWSGTGWGWDNKAVRTSGSSDTYYDDYVYMGSNASWSGSTCVGVERTKWNAPMKASCMPEFKVAASGKTYKMKDGIAWVLMNPSLKWHDVLCEFADPANPPAGWTWDGAQWVEVTATTP